MPTIRAATEILPGTSNRIASCVVTDREMPRRSGIVAVEKRRRMIKVKMRDGPRKDSIFSAVSSEGEAIGGLYRLEVVSPSADFNPGGDRYDV
jgi:hypothetical protein